MKTRFALITLGLVPSLLLIGCGDDPAPVDDEEPREASGEVLEGSISDAMLPIDQLRSQAPLAEPEPEPEPNVGGAGGAGAADDTSTTRSESAPNNAAAPEAAGEVDSEGDAQGE